MNIVKELRKLLRFRVLIVRLWGGGGEEATNQIRQFLRIRVSSSGGGKVCVSGKNSRTSSISAVTGGGRRRRHGNSYHPHRNL